MKAVLTAEKRPAYISVTIRNNGGDAVLTKINRTSRLPFSLPSMSESCLSERRSYRAQKSAFCPKATGRRGGSDSVSIQVLVQPGPERRGGVASVKP